jgi:hypothetical protein
MKGSMLCLLLTFVLTLEITQAQTSSPESAKKRIVMLSGKLQTDETIKGAGIIASWGNERIYIFTANHVVRDEFGKDATELFVEFYDLPSEPVPVLQILRDKDFDRDLAVIAVDMKLVPQNVLNNLPPLTLGDVNALTFPDPLFTIGYKGSKPWTVLGLSEYSDKTLDMISLNSSSIDRGASGGGLFNENWELIGMVLDTDGSAATALRIDIIAGLLSQWRYPAINTSTSNTPSATTQLTPETTNNVAATDITNTEVTSGVTIIAGYPCEASIVVTSSIATMLGEVRTEPAVTAPLTTAVRQGSSVTVIEEKRESGGSWYNITYGLTTQNRSGWLPSFYVELSKSCPTPPQSEPQTIETTEDPTANAVYPCEAVTVSSSGTTSLLNQVRKLPLSNASLTSPVRGGATVSVMEKRSEGGEVWYRISYSYNDEDSLGWLLGLYLVLSEACPK